MSLKCTSAPGAKIYNSSHLSHNRQSTHLRAWANLSDETSYLLAAAAKQHPTQGLTLNSLLRCTSEKISPPAAAGGGHHAKRERSTKSSQDAFEYLAVSLAGENSRRKEH